MTPTVPLVTTLRRILLVLTLLILAACASVPLGTMWKMKRLGPEGLSQADPADVLAAIQSEESFLEILNPSLSVSFETRYSRGQLINASLVKFPALVGGATGLERIE